MVQKVVCSRVGTREKLFVMPQREKQKILYILYIIKPWKFMEDRYS